MQILLKLAQKFKMSGKTKIYLLSVKNRKFVDQTFDELYMLKKISWSKNTTFFSYSVFLYGKYKIES